MQGSDRADEIRQHRQNRAQLERTLNQRPRVTQSGEAAAKDLTADLKLTRYPRSLAATLAAFPSVSLFPQLGSLITRISIGRNASTASCTACPPVCGKCGLAKAFGVGNARRLRIAFDQRPSPTKATRGRVGTPKVPRLRDETQRAKICASSPRRVRPVANCENFHR